MHFFKFFQIDFNQFSVVADNTVDLGFSICKLCTAAQAIKQPGAVQLFVQPDNFIGFELPLAFVKGNPYADAAMIFQLGDMLFHPSRNIQSD